MLKCLPSNEIPNTRKTLDANDCPSADYQFVSEQLNKLKSMTDIKPKVTEDLTTILQKFPCYDTVLTYLRHFVSSFLLQFELVNEDLFSFKIIFLFSLNRLKNITAMNRK